MPELPDIEAYLHALRQSITGHRLDAVRLANPFFLRSVAPPPAEARGRTVAGVRRIGKRIVIELDGPIFAAIHLMIAGRLHWKERGAKLVRGRDLAAFDFDNGTLTVTEAGTKKRASLHMVEGVASLGHFERGGVDVFTCSRAIFEEALRRENHTLKRTLTDPRLFDGIGNAYSDEILHRARLPPLQMSRNLDDKETGRLFASARAVLAEWKDQLIAEAEEKFPEGVTAFRPDMAAHGKFGKPCPVCGTAIQRIRYHDNETNYCPRCQTGGKVYADRALSRLLKDDWPKSIEELEEFNERRNPNFEL